MKKALIFSPYLETLGGGEVYTLHFAKALEKLGYKIEIATNATEALEKVNDRFGIDVSNFEVNQEAYQLFRSRGQVWETYKLTSNFDIVFFLSDGSIPFLFGKKNFLHFQVPFTHLKQTLVNSIKLRNLHVVCNSEFTKDVIDRGLVVNSTVLYPPVDQKKSLKKVKQILGVGRFTNTLQDKRQDILIEAFKKLVDSGVKGWKLVLVGNTSQKESGRLLKRLERMSKGYKVEYKTDVSFKDLNKEYGKSSIYWHASGYGVDEVKEPEKVEHFGLVTVEAMSAGAIPIVINKGGQKEIVEEGSNGYVFEDQQDLVEKTKKVIEKIFPSNSSFSKKNKLQKNAIKTAKTFSADRFYKEVKKLVD